MKPISLLQAMGDIPDEYIESALPGRQKKESGKVISFFRRREIMVLAAAAVLLIITFALAPGLFRPVEDPGHELAVNPYAVYESLEEAEKAAGFTMHVPESFEGSSSRKYALIDGKIIEVTYLDADGDQIMNIRKGTGEEDISGDYSEYSREAVMDAAGISVTVKGEEDLIFLAVWQEEDYSWAVSFSEGAAEKDLAEVIKSVMDRDLLR